MTDLSRKINSDLSDVGIGNLVQTDAGPGEPHVVFFGISDEVRTMIRTIASVGGSRFFQKLWIDNGKKARRTFAAEDPPRTHLSITNVEELVWRPARDGLASLRERCLDGSITLREVDEHFRSRRGDYGMLASELSQMIPDYAGKKGRYDRQIGDRIKEIKLYHELSQFTDAANAVLDFRAEMALEGDFQIVEDLKDQVRSVHTRSLIFSCSEPANNWRSLFYSFSRK